jgi:hypothetical protein
MKYMILIYSSPATWNALSQEQRDRMEREHTALVEQLVESGEWVGGNVLADPSQAHAMRKGAVTDGPFIEAKEHLAGYDVVDCDSLERALEIAALVPDAEVCGVEVRPIMEV